MEEIRVRPEVLKFFDAKGLQPHKLIEGRPRGTTASQVLEAMESVFDAVKSGEEIPRLGFAPAVWQRAKTVRGKKFDSLLRSIKEDGLLKRRVEELEGETVELKKKLVRCGRQVDGMKILCVVFFILLAAASVLIFK